MGVDGARIATGMAVICVVGPGQNRTLMRAKASTYPPASPVRCALVLSLASSACLPWRASLASPHCLRRVAVSRAARALRLSAVTGDRGDAGTAGRTLASAGRGGGGRGEESRQGVCRRGGDTETGIRTWGKPFPHQGRRRAGRRPNVVSTWGTRFPHATR